MTIVLIQPSQFKDGVSVLYGKLGTIVQPPMGLAMLGAVLLAAGYDVDVVDADAEGLDEEAIAARVVQHQAPLVGMSVTTPIFRNAVRLADRLKAALPATKIVLGGYHPSYQPEACLAPASIDYVVKGEGERTIVELVQAVAAGPTPERLRAIHGLFFKLDGQVVANPPRALIADLDSLPRPARHLFKSQHYTYPDTKYAPAFPVYTSRGCPGLCTFCQQQLITQRKLRLRSAPSVADEIEYLIATYGAREIHIWDDMFTYQKRRVLELRDELLRRRIKIAIAFVNGIRVDSASPEVLQAMRDMGGYSVAFGVESGSQAILDRAQKRTNLEQIRQAVANARNIGFETWGFFLLGLLGENAETVEETIRFALELDLDVAKFHILKPFPGSEVYQQMKDLNLILDYDVEKYGIHAFPVHRTEALSPAQLYNFQREAYRRFYFRPHMLLRHLARMGTLTRMRNNLRIAWGISQLAFRGQQDPAKG